VGQKKQPSDDSAKRGRVKKNPKSRISDGSAESGSLPAFRKEENGKMKNCRLYRYLARGMEDNRLAGEAGWKGVVLKETANVTTY